MNPAPLLRQRGTVLLLLLLALVTLTAQLLRAPLGTGAAGEDHSRSARALARAKEALIGYAATYPDTHASAPQPLAGYLPCPDVNNDGNAEGSCGSANVSAVGRLPWRTLGLSPLEQECLWYVVAGISKNNPKGDLLNENTNGQLVVVAADGITRLTGAGEGEQAVAAIIAPGPPRPGQDRSGSGGSGCPGNTTTANYLDRIGSIDNASPSPVRKAITTLAAGEGEAGNDRILFISAREILSPTDAMGTPADKRMGAAPYDVATMLPRVAECIAAFGRGNTNFNGGLGDKRLPWAAPLALADVSLSAGYSDAGGRMTGHVPSSVAQSIAATAHPWTNAVLDTVSHCPGEYNGVKDWWDNQKDHLFYAIAANFRPDNAAKAGVRYPCGTGSAGCLQVNGGARAYAAVVIHAGKRMAGQRRPALAGALYPDQSTPAAYLGNYLEDANVATVLANGGNGNFAKVPSPAMNDVLVCLRQDLSVDATCADPLLEPPTAPPSEGLG